MGTSNRLNMCLQEGFLGSMSRLEYLKCLSIFLLSSPRPACCQVAPLPGLEYSRWSSNPWSSTSGWSRISEPGDDGVPLEGLRGTSVSSPWRSSSLRPGTGACIKRTQSCELYRLKLFFRTELKTCSNLCKTQKTALITQNY